MDPITAVVANGGTESAEFLKRESDSFLHIVLGEPAKAFGGLIADKVNARRHANLVKITVEAKRKLDEAGVSPREVPLKIIHPMVEAAALEEDPDLQMIWSNFWANAADPRQISSVLPSFPLILKELTARDVKLLDAIYKHVDSSFAASFQGHDTRVALGFQWRRILQLYEELRISRRPNITSITEQEWNEHREDFEADARDFRVALETLIRNGLLTEKVTAINMGGTNDMLVSNESLHSYYWSDLGWAFVKACSHS